jgi:hypothetical protein
MKDRMMYTLSLFLHNTTRWLVFGAMLWAVIQVWHGIVRRREWNAWDNRAGLAFATLFSIQFVWGLLLYFEPFGIAQAAARDMGAAMRVRELRFFGLEHPLQMVIALALVHLGRARSRKAGETRLKFRWAAITFTLAAVLIVIAIPWWRPLLRGV